MSAAIWGLIGTLVGGLIAIGGNWLLHRVERDERTQRERREAATRARDERKVAYVRLLSSARQLRYRARPGSSADADEIDSLKSELSVVHYEIELIAAADVVSYSDAVRRKVLDYIDLAIEEASALNSPIVQRSSGLERNRYRARAAVNEFIVKARRDLGMVDAKNEAASGLADAARVGSARGQMTLTTPERETLEFEYGEVCRSHAATVDFRGKLLALLPIASGAALFLLLEQRDPEAPLAAIGVFGCAVTLGLFIYELRNIQECNLLIRQGGCIEEALEVPKGMRRFQDKPKARLNGFLGATGAGWIVYTAIFCGWLYVAVTDTRLAGSVRWWLPVLFILLLSARFAVWQRVRPHSRRPPSLASDHP